MSVRCTLSIAIGVLLAASVSFAADTPSINPSGPSTIGLVEWRMSDREKIEYPDVPKPLPDSVKNACQRVVRFQIEQLKKWGLSTFKAPTEEYTWALSELRKAELWEQLRQDLPEQALPVYSVQAYEHFMAWSLPRLVAPYGIHAQPTYEFQGSLKNPDKPYLRAFESVVAFFPVEKIEREEVTRWGKTFRRDVIWIGGPMWLDDQTESQKSYAPAAGEAYYQSIFLYRPGLEAVTWDKLDEKERGFRTSFIEKFKQIRPVNVLDRTLKHATPEKAAVEYAFFKTTLDKLTPPESFEDEQSRAVEHETRHVIDFGNAEFQKAFAPMHTSLFVEHLKSDNSKRAHFEINGTLAELRFAKRKDETIRRLVLLERRATLQDYPHDQAGRWVLMNMVELATKDPARYGVAMDPNIALSMKGQLLLQIADLPDQIIERFADDILAVHARNYQEDFGEDYLQWRLKQP